MHRLRSIRVPLLTALVFALASVSPAFAADDVSKVQNFITNIITVLVTLAGLVAVVFFVIGGFSYITSSGNPERLDRAKQTIMYSGIGLAVALAAYVLVNVITQIAQKSF